MLLPGHPWVISKMSAHSVGFARFDFLDPDPDPQKYVDPRIPIQGQNINQKLQKKTFLLSKP